MSKKHLGGTWRNEPRFPQESGDSQENTETLVVPSLPLGCFSCLSFLWGFPFNPLTICTFRVSEDSPGKFVGFERTGCVLWLASRGAVRRNMGPPSTQSADGNFVFSARTRCPSPAPWARFRCPGARRCDCCACSKSSGWSRTRLGARHFGALGPKKKLGCSKRADRNSPEMTNLGLVIPP